MSDFYHQYGEISFVWDEDKNRENLRKHKIDFETAALVFNDDMRLEFIDYWHGEEVRYNTIGLVHDILFVVYTDRIDTESGKSDIRLISARLASQLEKDAYNNNILGRK